MDQQHFRVRPVLNYRLGRDDDVDDEVYVATLSNTSEKSRLIEIIVEHEPANYIDNLW